MQSISFCIINELYRYVGITNRMSALYCLLYSALHSCSANKSDKLQAIPFLQCTSTHNSIQGCPVHSHCHVLQYASHMRSHKCGPLSLLMQTQGWPTSPTPSNSHWLLRARFSVCGSLSSRTQPHVLVCVCAVLPPLFHHMYSVCAPSFTSVRCVQSPC